MQNRPPCTNEKERQERRRNAVWILRGRLNRGGSFAAMHTLHIRVAMDAQRLGWYGDQERAGIALGRTKVRQFLFVRDSGSREDRVQNRSNL